MTRTSQAGPLPDAGTRRVPVQARSRQRVAALLDAAERVLVDEGAEHLTAGRVCQVAGIPASALYQYFADREAVLEALGERYLQQFRSANAALLEQAGSEQWEDVVGVLLEAHVHLYRTLPGFRSLWLAHSGGALAARYDDHLDAVADGLLAIFDVQIPGLDGALAASACRVAVRAADALLRRAFAVHPDGDVVVLHETDRLLRLYLRDVLDRMDGPT